MKSRPVIIEVIYKNFLLKLIFILKIFIIVLIKHLNLKIRRLYSLFPKI